MRRRVLMQATLALAVSAIAAGCATTPERARVPAARGLVIAESLQVIGATASDGWEARRRDAAMGIGGRPGALRYEEVEIRTNDRRSTSNGRVRETSRTTVRSRTYLTR